MDTSLSVCKLLFICYHHKLSDDIWENKAAIPCHIGQTMNSEELLLQGRKQVMLHQVRQA